MYGNLKNEMSKNKVTQTDIAAVIKKTNNAVCKKIAGDFSWKAEEMFAIQKAFFPDKTIEYLFTKC